MSTYAIGDVQGCFTELMNLLELIQFNPNQDCLWFTGDLVNRGPDSLGVLRYVSQLGDHHISVLGNHDLHLLAIAYGEQTPHALDTLDELLAAPDCDSLITWLRHRPLMHHDPSLNFIMSHAGFAPAWSLAHAQTYAQEVESVLQSAHPEQVLGHLYGNQPDLWQNRLQGAERLRCIINYFTRMRYCHRDGRLDFSYKGALSNKPPALIPWFEVSPRAMIDINIIFGHWAALAGQTHQAHIYALDTGCVWGKTLTAMRLEDRHLFSTPCSIT